MVYLGWDVYRWAVRQMQIQPDAVKDELRVFLGSHPHFKEIEDYLPTQRGKELDGSHLDLKKHQIEALKPLQAMRDNSETIALLYHVTGTGKTVTAVMDAKNCGGRTLFLAHTQELVNQAAETFRKLWPSVTVGRYVESMKQPNAHVVCGSVQSVALHLDEFQDDAFDYLIVDEAHHASADTYQKILSYFKPAFTLGLTATPERTDDGKVILEIFKNTAHKLDIQTAVEIGELVPIRCIRIHTNIDLTKVRFNSVQYNIRDLESKIYVPERNRLIVDTWLQYVRDKRTVVFCASVKHAEQIAELFREAGVRAAAVSGGMKQAERKEFQDKFVSREIQVLCACDLLNEGWNCPETQVLFMARPTMSRVLYTQQLGRGMRLYPGKESLMVFDFVDNASQYNMPQSLHRLFKLKEYRPGQLAVAPGDRKAGEAELYVKGEKPEALIDWPVDATDYELVDIFNWQDEAEGMISQMEFVRRVDVQTETIERYVREGKLVPDLDVYYETARRLHELGQSTEEVERLLMQTQIMDTLATKLSGVRSAFSGAGNALPLVPQIRESLEDSNWENAGFEGANPLGLSERSESAQTQNPLAYGAGYMGSMLGQYALGSAAMKAIPGVGSALGRAGERLASTGAAQALQRIPVLGELATPQAISGMLGDSILDLGLDTLPMTLRMTGEYLDQQKNGAAPGEEELSIGDILKEAGINIATNAGFNALGELAPAAMRALSDLFHGRPVMSAAQGAALDKMAQGLKLTDTEQRMVDNLTEAYPDYVQQREFLPLEAEEPVILDDVLRQEEQGSVNELARAYRAGTLTNAQMETLKPGGVNRAAFEQATGVKLPETSSETRRVLREGLDNGQRVAYSETMSSTGGAQNEFTGAERVRSLGEDALPMGQGMGFADGGGGNPADGDSVLRGFLSPTENINNAVARTGATQNVIPAVMDDEAARPLAELDVNTADWNEINRSPEIQQARRKAMFETPTVATNTPERQALRQEIAEDLMRMGSFSGKDAGGNEIFNGPVKQERRADIVIGPPAAGKSSVLANPLSQKYGSRIIDSDMAKTMLPEFDGGFGAGRVHEESAFIAETLMLRAAVQNGENIVIPWVGKNPQKLRDTLKRLKQNGYSVHLSLNELDPDKAARRAVSRFQNTGRFVDPNYVLSVGWKPSEVYDILKKEGGFDSYVKYSNDVPYGQPARLVEGPGVVEEVQAGRMGRLGGRPGTGNSYRVGYGENATERVSSLDNQAAFSVGEIPYLSEETAETFSEYIPSLMDDASMSVSAPVSGLTRGQATGSALETDIPNGMRERGFAESLRTKSDLPDEVKAEFVDTPEIYRQLSNTETIAKADAAWGNGLEEAQRNFRSLLETRDPAAIPLGKNIADELIRQGKSEDAAQLLRDMSAALTSSGQFSQAAAIALMKEDPMTALSYLQKQIDKMNAEGAKKFGKKWKDFTLTDNEIKAFGDVAKGDEEALKSLYEGVGRRIAKEYPATMNEKVVELSHIAMLLNPRTQVRNVLSNIAMMPATAISDKISAVGQKLYSKANPNFKPELALTASKESKDLAAQVYDRIKGRIDNTASKWENSAMQGIREKEMFKGLNGRTAGDIPVLEDVGSRIKGGLNTISQKLTGDSVFDALSSEKSVTENVRQLTYGLLELGDKGFVAQRFKSYLSKAIEASGAKTLDAVPASAIDRAVQEAMKATFKDDNALTRLVSSIKRNTGFVGETLLPFTKTPANVTMRALDYSPAGIASAVKMAKNGAEASAVIDQVAKATTGTLAILLGIGLYNKGIITGPEDEDPDKAAFQKQQGWLPYAVKFGDNYYTYDWAQPGSMGLVLGSTIMSQLDKDGSIEAKDLASIIKNSVSAFGDTLLQQSTLQNLLDVFSGYGSPTENMTNEVLETPQRLIPSLVGATARVADTTQRSTYSKGDFLKTQIDTLKSKIPGLSQTLPATYDTWGNEVQRSGNSLEAAFAQYLNPGQLGYSGGQTPIDEEIMRLYDATNNSGVFPHKADRTVTIAGEEIDLDNQQYSEFQRLLGQASYEAANAFLEMPGYDSLADEQKADALQNAYAAAKDIALSEMFDDYSVPKTRGKYADMYEEFGTDGLALWAYYKQIENWDGEGGVRNEDRKNAIDSLPGLTRAQRSFMWILSNGSETSNPYD